MGLEETSLPAEIVKAIKSENSQRLNEIVAAHPEQLHWNTPFAGETWLGYAAGLGKLEVVKLLVTLGADINQGDHRDNSKPICSASAIDALEVVEYLIENGAILETETSVQNPLFSAIVGRSPRIVRLLLDAGIDCKARYNSNTMQDMDATAFALFRGENECAQLIANWNTKGDHRAAVLLLDQAKEIANRNVRADNA